MLYGCGSGGNSGPAPETPPTAVNGWVGERSAWPQARIEKRPALRGKQGMWTLFGEAGQLLKRGHELAGVLFPLERRLLKLVDE